jgi:hypothetical protein
MNTTHKKPVAHASVETETKEVKTPKPIPVTAPKAKVTDRTYAHDRHAGQGGAYVIDENGNRVPDLNDPLNAPKTKGQ